jgi:hypothetical protein
MPCRTQPQASQESNSPHSFHFFRVEKPQATDGARRNSKTNTRLTRPAFYHARRLSCDHCPPPYRAFSVGAFLFQNALIRGVLPPSTAPNAGRVSLLPRHLSVAWAIRDCRLAFGRVLDCVLTVSSPYLGGVLDLYYQSKRELASQQGRRCRPDPFPFNPTTSRSVASNDITTINVAPIAARRCWRIQSSRSVPEASGLAG